MTSVLEQVKTLTVRPGAKPGQIILGVDLSEVERSSDVLESLADIGYAPQIRYLQLKTGLHVFAVLKDEQHDPTQWISDDYLIDEWESLREQIQPDAVHLWRGHPQTAATAT